MNGINCMNGINGIKNRMETRLTAKPWTMVREKILDWNKSRHWALGTGHWVIWGELKTDGFVRG